MKKLKLEIDALKVESFEAGAALERGGTVRGHGPVTPLCDSVRVCAPKEGGGDSAFYGTCDLECTGSCGLTYCPGDCTHGQTLGATCACATYATCAPDVTCSLEC